MDSEMHTLTKTGFVVCSVCTVAGTSNTVLFLAKSCNSAIQLLLLGGHWAKNTCCEAREYKLVRRSILYYMYTI